VLQPCDNDADARQKQRKHKKPQRNRVNRKGKREVHRQPFNNGVGAVETAGQNLFNQF
jgi:hypothetical protein